MSDCAIGNINTDNTPVTWKVNLPFDDMTLKIDGPNEADADCYIFGWKMNEAKHLVRHNSNKNIPALSKNEKEYYTPRTYTNNIVEYI